MIHKNVMLLLVLAIAVFGVITTEVAVIGLLPQLGSQLHVTPTQVGFLVSIYAVIVAITGPFITLLLSRYNKKHILLTILLIFVISNLIYATTSSFNLILFFRILPALFHATFFAVALVVAANSVAKEESPRAVAKVFAGVAVGLVLGMPVSSFIAEHLSLSAAFYFGSISCLLAFIGILFFIPSSISTKKINFSSQLIILRNGKLWLTIVTVTAVFSAMFANFSYIADYLAKITRLDNDTISVFLVLFGVSGIFGNFIFSTFLQKNAIKTTKLYPILLTLLYVFIWILGFSPIAICILIFFWGALHSAGLVISQTWLMKEANEAPEFANSLYISFSNLGITVGAMVGGWGVSYLGVHSVVLISIIFTVTAFLSIYLKSKIDNNIG
ncbi:MFS transporter [Xenorhabdus bovienii]|uniref:MFS transporter n=1 Tax=Xenorhabdus bovienii TaxID=40576 RepID=UPI003DA35E88